MSGDDTSLSDGTTGLSGDDTDLSGGRTGRPDGNTRLLDDNTGLPADNTEELVDNTAGLGGTTEGSDGSAGLPPSARPSLRSTGARTVPLTREGDSQSALSEAMADWRGESGQSARLATRAHPSLACGVEAPSFP